MAAGQGRNRLADMAAAVTGFIAAASGVYAWLGKAWPTQHDLSDIGTGLMRLLLAFLAGLVGAVVVAFAARWLHTRHAAEDTDFPP